MVIKFSAIASSKTAQFGDVQAFSAHSIDMGQLGDWASPVAALDHYRLRGRPFAPHPHAGFSAVACLLEDSATLLRSRDSLGNDLRTEPGGVVWTQAANGLVHEDTTADLDREIHGVQVFVNLTSRNKSQPPKVLQLQGGAVPVWRSQSGDRVRVLAGAYAGLSSPLSPVEPFTLLHATLETRIWCDLLGGQNMIVFVLNGAARVCANSEERTVESARAVGLKGDATQVMIDAVGPSEVMILAAAPIREPYVRQGNAYIMNDQSQIDAALVRYQAGDMGRVEARTD